MWGQDMTFRAEIWTKFWEVIRKHGRNFAKEMLDPDEVKVWKFLAERSVIGRFTEKSNGQEYELKHVETGIFAS